ncbi:MAG: hypothetical protein HY318_17435, partial [Armatimonadetes bacterium]|nr:hypothetical protein [Armatimonadota bacterium]
MSRKPWSLVFYVFVLMAVMPVGMRAYYQRWWIRDPDRLCRIALAAMDRKDYRTARPLLIRATRLKPDWFVPYHMLSEDVWRNGWFDKAIDWVCDITPSPLDSVADYLRECRIREVRGIVESVDPRDFEFLGDYQGLWEVWKKDGRA